MANGDGTDHREIYGRIGNLETGFKALQTELSGYARNTSEAIQRLTSALTLEAEKSEERADSAARRSEEQLQQARNEWASWRDQSRPNWIGILAVFISALVAVGSLYKQSTDAQIRPLTIETAHNAQRISALQNEVDSDITREIRHIEEKANLYRDRNIDSHLRLEERIKAIEEALAARTSDADDRQDAELRYLQKSIDKLP